VDEWQRGRKGRKERARERSKGRNFLYSRYVPILRRILLNLRYEFSLFILSWGGGGGRTLNSGGLQEGNATSLLQWDLDCSGLSLISTTWLQSERSVE